MCKRECVVVLRAEHNALAAITFHSEQLVRPTHCPSAFNTQSNKALEITKPPLLLVRQTQCEGTETTEPGSLMFASRHCIVFS